MTFLEELQSLSQDFVNSFESANIAVSLLYEVIERTGNYREGYYSLRRINELGVSQARHMYVSAIPEDEASMLNILREAIQANKNLMDTVLTEIERIED